MALSSTDKGGWIPATDHQAETDDQCRSWKDGPVRGVYYCIIYASCMRCRHVRSVAMTQR